ncbi:aldehyde oxidase GLOX1-like [Argentina anserina]|uniref:aldehyde oxidase GLOX1-like n=1 Tax=Argentina anserina TaxID=57926 RepID=UPI0021762680|nr:aldehyde oxidase GLOX1-like [Potentilla anserina]
MKLFCILALFFASVIDAHWRGIPFVPNPLLAHQGFEFGFEHQHNKHDGGFHGIFGNDDSKDSKAAVGDQPNVEVQADAAVDVNQPQPDVVPDDQPNLAEAGGDAVPDAPAQPDFPVGNNMGTWDLLLEDSGVSVMHINLLQTNKVMFYDAAAFHISKIKLPNNDCIPWEDQSQKQFCDDWAHAVEYDIEKNTIRPLKVDTDPWCSSGGIMPDGRFISTGGWFKGIRSTRYFTPCTDGKCDFKTYPEALADKRWYATQITLADGRLFLVGGRGAYSYEYVLPEGQDNTNMIKSLFLDETTEMDENNLYPFVYQTSDPNNVYIFTNDRSILFNTKTNKQVKEFPKLPGGSRNYPASGMSVLLPIELKEQNPADIPLDVLICGGAPKDAFRKSMNEPREFVPALDDCAKMRITDPNPVWETDKMPTKRVMGDMLHLPTGDLLIINGAMAGSSAWYQAEEPNFTPHIYNPRFPKGQRFFNMAPSKIARLYHSTSAVLPSGKILVAGSNPNDRYLFAPDEKSKYLTEMRLEIFNPPYMDKALDIHRPVINADATDKKLKYGATFGVQFKLNEADKPTKNDIKLHMYAVPFTTHGYSMNQRMLVLAIKDFKPEGPGVYRLTALAPPSGALAPPGYYLLFPVHRGAPGAAVWVSINQ